MTRQFVAGFSHMIRYRGEISGKERSRNRGSDVRQSGIRRYGQSRFFIAPVAVAIRLALLSFLLGGPALSLDRGAPVSKYVHTVWQTDDGLPQNYVVSIAQTTDGYLWLATQEGLARFDGVKFTVFNKQNTEIEQNDIETVASDKAGGLWFGTEGAGLYFLKDGRLSHYSTENGLPGNKVDGDSVEAVCVDHEGAVWIGSLAGLSRFKDGRFTAFSTANGLCNNQVLAVYEDLQGAIWIGTQGGVSSFKDGNFHSYTTRDGLANDLVRSFWEDQGGVLWMGTLGGLTSLKDGKFTNYSTRDGLSNNSVLSLLEDRAGNLWIGTDGGGLNRYRDGKFEAYRTADGLSQEAVASIYEDVEGSLWIGTYGGGLNRLKDGRFTTISTKSGLSNETIRTILEDREGSIWIATLRGLNRLKNGKFTTFTQRDGLASDSVLSLYEDAAGALWVGTRSGLNRFQNGKFTTYTTRNGLSDDTVLSIIGGRSGQSGGDLWIGTDSGLNRLTGGRIVSYSVKDGLTNDCVWTVLEDRDGTLWIGTNGGGLNRWKDGRFSAMSTADGLADNVVLCLFQDKEGVLWIGTGGGLSMLKDGKLAAFSQKDGLFDDNIFEILEDDAGNLWMSCNKGIFEVSKAELARFANKEITRISSVSYGAADGMKSRECNGGFQPAGWKAHDGRLWFPTTKGVAIIDPASIKLNDLPPPVVVEEVRVDDATVDPATAPRFSPGKARLEFHFTALSFLAPEKVRFKYKLEGFDRDWLDAGTRREASYTNLPPGDYHFKVIACNNDGVWNQTGSSFNFQLAPHFYQTIWFYALLIVAAALLTLAGYRMRVRQMRRQFGAVLVERNRMAREIHDTLAQGFVAIGFQVDAASKRITASPQAAREHLEMARKLIRSSLTEARRSVWELRQQASRGGNLASALSETAREMTSGTSVRVDFRVRGTPQTLSAMVESNLLRVGQEALANALKHAAAENILLELSFDHGHVAIRVKDDGLGFRTDEAPTADSGHFGLVGMAERAEQLRGRLSLKSNPGEGTEVELEVPIT
jgi:ligand-binding sensor domain-containing protein/signal transduction histidine kinase